MLGEAASHMVKLAQPRHASQLCNNNKKKTPLFSVAFLVILLFMQHIVLSWQIR